MSKSTSIKGLLHAAITVSDLQRSIAFYRDTLGFPVRRTLTIPGGPNIVLLSIGDHGEVELFEQPATRLMPEGASDPRRVGLKHFAMEVDDVEAVWTELEAKGVKSFGTPLFRQPNGPKACHFLDPDGVILEIVQTHSR